MNANSQANNKAKPQAKTKAKPQAKTKANTKGNSRSQARAVIVFAIATVAGLSTACGQAKSGLYGNLTLGVDGTAVTGAFSDARPGNGTEDAPQFSCLFVLRGELGSGADGATKVTVWSPPDTATTSGTLTFEKDAVKLRLAGDPPGCAATGDTFASQAYEEPSVKDGKWTSVRLVSATTAEARQAPVNGSSAKARLSKGDVVVVYRRIGPWLEGEDLNAQRAVRGWLRESDLAPGQP